MDESEIRKMAQAGMEEIFQKALIVPIDILDDFLYEELWALLKRTGLMDEDAAMKVLASLNEEVRRVRNKRPFGNQGSIIPS